MSITNRLERIEARRGGGEKRFYARLQWEAECIRLQFNKDGIPSLGQRKPQTPEPKKPPGYDEWSAKRAKQIAAMQKTTIEELRECVRRSIEACEPTPAAPSVASEVIAEPAKPVPADRLREYREDSGARLESY